LFRAARQPPLYQVFPWASVDGDSLDLDRSGLDPLSWAAKSRTDVLLSCRLSGHLYFNTTNTLSPSFLLAYRVAIDGLAVISPLPVSRRRSDVRTSAWWPFHIGFGERVPSYFPEGDDDSTLNFPLLTAVLFPNSCGDAIKAAFFSSV